MDRYGNAAKQPDNDEARLLLGQTEGYVEYNAAGRIIKGEEVKVPSPASIVHIGLSIDLSSLARLHHVVVVAPKGLLLQAQQKLKVQASFAAED